jgi:hypothetical protein
MNRTAVLLAAGALTLGVVASGCGSSSSPASTSKAAASTSASTSTAGGLAPPTKDSTPTGDIPDNQVYVTYAPPAVGFSVTVPEGWSRSTEGGATTFADKLNSVRMALSPQEKTVTAATVTAKVLPQLAKTVPGYAAGKVSTVTRTAGTAVKVTYQATSKPDDVTGKTHRDAVERYEFTKGGKVAVLTLTGPVGADNVDPWKKVTDAFRWTR